ncbi:MAG: hypothetical protein ACLQUZ_12855 [Rhizomicrobium sp.]
MAATPVVLLAPAPDMTFMSLPSGASYTSNQYALVTITNGSVADEEALIAAGCQALTGGLVTTVAALPSPIAGSSAYVTDSTATLAAGLGNAVVGGGSYFTPVYADNANTWRIG